MIDDPQKFWAYTEDYDCVIRPTSTFSPEGEIYTSIGSGPFTLNEAKQHLREHLAKERSELSSRLAEVNSYRMSDFE